VPLGIILFCNVTVLQVNFLPWLGYIISLNGMIIFSSSNKPMTYILMIRIVV
jgi:hypothetical protein